MRRSTEVNLTVIVCILYIASMFYLGANYDNYLNFLMVKSNITAFCFGLISILIITITILSVKLQKTINSKNYYSEEMHKHQCKEWEKEKQILDLRQLVKELKNKKSK